MYGYQGRGEGEGMDGETGIDIYTLLILCKNLITNENLLYNSGQLYSVFCGDLNGKEI